MITHRASWAAGAVTTVTLGAFALAGPASAAVTASPVNTVVATIPVFSPTLSDQEPVGAAVDPIRGLAYIVASTGRWTSSASSPTQVIHTINTPDYTSSTGFGLQDITVDPLTQNVYVTDLVNNAVYKISEITDQVTATISTPDPTASASIPWTGKSSSPTTAKPRSRLSASTPTR